VAIGSQAGLRTEAFITSMDAPLGRAVGNAVELIECVESLKGRGPEDLVTVVVALASRILKLSERFDERGAEATVRKALDSGAALEKLRALITWQGGDAGVLDDYSRLPGAAARHVVAAERGGHVTALRADLIGRASMTLGAGRQRIDDTIDRGAGILIAKKPGERVDAGDTIVELLYNDDRRLKEAISLVREAIQVSDDPPVLKPLILGTVR
jgi:thymidine phosphorylase